MKTFLASIFASTPLGSKNAQSGKESSRNLPEKRATSVVAAGLLAVSLVSISSSVFAARPVANNDSASTRDGVRVMIPVLNNDRGLSDKPIRVTIASKDSDLSVSVTNTNRIRCE